MTNNVTWLHQLYSKLQVPFAHKRNREICRCLLVVADHVRRTKECFQSCVSICPQRRGSCTHWYTGTRGRWPICQWKGTKQEWPGRKEFPPPGRRNRDRGCGRYAFYWKWSHVTDRLQINLEVTKMSWGTYKTTDMFNLNKNIIKAPVTSNLGFLPRWMFFMSITQSELICLFVCQDSISNLNIVMYSRKSHCMYHQWRI